MSTKQLVLFVSLLAGLGILVVQNLASLLSLVMLGTPIITLPLGIWILLGILSGAITTAAIAGLQSSPLSTRRKRRSSSPKRDRYSARSDWEDRSQSPSDRASDRESRSTSSSRSESGYRSNLQDRVRDRQGSASDPDPARSYEDRSEQRQEERDWPREERGFEREIDRGPDRDVDREPNRRQESRRRESAQQRRDRQADEWETRRIWNWESWEDWGRYDDRPMYDEPPPVVDAEVVSATPPRDYESDYRPDYRDDEDEYEDYGDRDYDEDYGYDDDPVADWQGYRVNDSGDRSEYGDDYESESEAPESWEDWQPPEGYSDDYTEDDYPDDSDESEAEPDDENSELEDWENWEGYEDYFERSPAPKDETPKATVYEVRRDPVQSSRSGSMYSFSYRTSKNAREQPTESINDRADATPDSDSAPSEPPTHEPSNSPVENAPSEEAPEDNDRDR